MDGSITCLSVGTYDDALTRGRKYALLASDQQNVKIKGNNGRMRWYPLSLFDLSGGEAPILVNWKFDTDVEDNIHDWAEVSFELSNGARRWCLFITPNYVLERLSQKATENWLWSNHLIIVDDITTENVTKILHYLDQHGSLIEASKALSSYPPDM